MVAERIQRADEVMSIETDIERKVVPGAGWNADERKPVGPRRRGRDPERPVATGHAERIRPVGHGFIDEGWQVVVRTEDEGVDPSLARPLDQPCLRCPAAAGPRVDEQDRSAGGSAACQPYRDRRRVTG